MKTISRRVADVIGISSSLLITLTDELLDMKLEKGDKVWVALEESDDGNRVIVVEKVQKQK